MSNLSRRDVLKSMAILATVAMASPAQRLLALPTSQSTIPQMGQQIFTGSGDHMTPFLSALEMPYAAPLNIHFENIIRGKNIGLLLYDLQNTRMVTALAPENPLPVASAFKGPLLMYFLDTVDPAIWRRVPVRYWNAISADAVPFNWRDDWQQHRAILRDLYQMLVSSDNISTSAVLSYAARAQGSTEPLVLFNDWAYTQVGISQLSALSAWNQGIDATMSPVDPRFLNRGTTISGQIVQFENMMTPRDIGLFYTWMLTDLSWSGLQVCRELLSTIRDNRGANLERLATELGGTPYSKNGSLITDDGTIITDAGVITLPDNRGAYLLVMLSMDAPETLATLFEELKFTLEGRYNELIHNHHYNAVSQEELAAIYMSHLSVAYPEQDTNNRHDGRYRYGFVIPEGVQIYKQPDETQTLHNPIIRSTRFGIHLLMQGALVRFVDVNADWIELMPDDDRDNVRVRLGTRVFLKREDVWPITLDYGTPIQQISDQAITPDDKFIVISLIARELIAFEGATPIMRVPIVLNEDATPRGIQVITSKWLARSMQPWAPGVPFTSFFGSEGYALHGSPWQRWATTVNQENITGRTSAGCVNIPDWIVQAGDYQRPADELLFRWIGGMENAQDRVFDYPSTTNPAIRIFSVDYLHNLRSYHRPQAITRFDANWDDIITAIEATPLQAPESFFV